MTNIYRGEIEANLNGKSYTLCLTLGALAELEEAFGCNDLIEVIERFQAGKVRAKEMIIILNAGLKGAGNDLAEIDTSKLKIEQGIQAYMTIIAKLLNATFSDQ